MNSKNLASCLVLVVFLIQLIACSDKSIDFAYDDTRYYKILYVTLYADHSDIFKIDINGNNFLQLTDNGKYNTNPSFSINGENILYESEGDIYIMDSSGADNRLLVSNAHNPSFERGGARVAYSACRDGQYGIFIVDTDGTNETKLIDNLNDFVVPNWSDGIQFITYISDNDLYRIKSDGADHQLLATGVEYYSWSNYGANIVYSVGNTDQSEIIRIIPDGTNLVRLTDNDYADYNPIGTLFDSNIAFKSDKDGDDAIWVMDIDGQNLRKLAAHAAPGIWTPDGRYFIYYSGSDDADEIYRYCMDTGKIRRLMDCDYEVIISSVWIRTMPN